MKAKNELPYKPQNKFFFLLLSIQISKELYDICFVRESVYITHIFNLYFYDTRETKIWNKSFWQVFNHDWILLLLKLGFFLKKVFTSAINARKWYGIQRPTRDWHIPYSAQKSMRLSCCENSQILQQKLYVLVELCENAMTLKYVIL